MINKLNIIVSIFLLVSCGDSNKQAKEELPKKTTTGEFRANIEALQDSLFKMNIESQLSKETLDKNEKIALQTKISVVRQELINQNLSYVKTFPEDSFAPYCLRNAQKIYDEIQAYQKSVSCMDSILINYPGYAMYNDVLEDKAVTLDFFVQPRDTAMIRSTYEKLISLSNLTEYKIQTYRQRLLNLDEDLTKIIH